MFIYKKIFYLSCFHKYVLEAFIRHQTVEILQERNHLNGKYSISRRQNSSNNNLKFSLFNSFPFMIVI